MAHSVRAGVAASRLTDTEKQRVGSLGRQIEQVNVLLNNEQKEWREGLMQRARSALDEIPSKAKMGILAKRVDLSQNKAKSPVHGRPESVHKLDFSRLLVSDRDSVIDTFVSNANPDMDDKDYRLKATAPNSRRDMVSDLINDDTARLMFMSTSEPVSHMPHRPVSARPSSSRALPGTMGARRTYTPGHSSARAGDASSSSGLGGTFITGVDMESAENSGDVGRSNRPSTAHPKLRARHGGNAMFSNLNSSIGGSSPGLGDELAPSQGADTAAATAEGMGVGDDGDIAGAASVSTRRRCTCREETKYTAHDLFQRRACIHEALSRAKAMADEETAVERAARNSANAQLASADSGNPHAGATSHGHSHRGRGKPPLGAALSGAGGDAGSPIDPLAALKEPGAKIGLARSSKAAAQARKAEMDLFAELGIDINSSASSSSESDAGGSDTDHAAAAQKYKFDMTPAQRKAAAAEAAKSSGAGKAGGNGKGPGSGGHGYGSKQKRRKKKLYIPGQQKANVKKKKREDVDADDVLRAKTLAGAKALHGAMREVNVSMKMRARAAQATFSTKQGDAIMAMHIDEIIKPSPRLRSCQTFVSSSVAYLQRTNSEFSEKVDELNAEFKKPGSKGPSRPQTANPAGRARPATARARPSTAGMGRYDKSASGTVGGAMRNIMRDNVRAVTDTEHWRANGITAHPSIAAKTAVLVRSIQKKDREALVLTRGLEEQVNSLQHKMTKVFKDQIRKEEHRQENLRRSKMQVVYKRQRALLSMIVMQGVFASEASVILVRARGLRLSADARNRAAIIIQRHFRHSLLANEARAAVRREAATTIQMLGRRFYQKRRLVWRRSAVKVITAFIAEAGRPSPLMVACRKFMASLVQIQKACRMFLNTRRRQLAQFMHLWDSVEARLKDTTSGPSPDRSGWKTEKTAHIDAAMEQMFNPTMLQARKASIIRREIFRQLRLYMQRVDARKRDARAIVQKRAKRQLFISSMMNFYDQIGKNEVSVQDLQSMDLPKDLKELIAGPPPSFQLLKRVDPFVVKISEGEMKRFVQGEKDQIRKDKQEVKRAAIAAKKKRDEEKEEARREAAAEAEIKRAAAAAAAMLSTPPKSPDS